MAHPQTPTDIEPVLTELRDSANLSRATFDRLERYIRAVIERSPYLRLRDEHEWDDFAAEGHKIAIRWVRNPATSDKLASGFGKHLEWRLLDYWQIMHREYDPKTKEMLPVATGLAYEHGGDNDANWVEPRDAALRSDDHARIESHVFLNSIIEGTADLQNPRVMGQLVGTPSARALTPGQARRLADEIEGERQTFDL